MIPALVAAGGLLLLLADQPAADPTALVATGDPRLDRLDAHLVAGWTRAGLPRRYWRLLKVMALRESINLQYAHRVHRDGVGLGVYGVHRRYFAGQVTRENPRGYSERRLLADPAANAEVAAGIFLAFLRSTGGDVWWAVERFNRGYGAQTAGDYAARTRAFSIVLDWRQRAS